MKSPQWTVYCHTHKESGRKYIGLTKQTMMQRWKEHVYQAKNSKDGRWHFPNAIRKYGKDAFEHKVLEIHNSLEEANLAEIKHIKELDTTNPSKGFNIKIGGDHIPHPVKNPWDRPGFREKQMITSKSKWTPELRKNHSILSLEIQSRPEVRAKASNKLKGRKLSKAHREKLSQIAKIIGVDHLTAANLGKKQSKEHIEKTRIGRAIYNAKMASMKTHKKCSKHGNIPLAECYVHRQKGKAPAYYCRECRRRYTNSYTKRIRMMKSVMMKSVMMKSVMM